MLAQQHVTHFNAPLHRHVQNGAVCRSRTDRCRIGRAFTRFLQEPSERNAGVQHQLDRHQRASRSPRASARAWPAVRVPRILWRRRMFAAMCLPAARRLAATILWATITGSDNFISILVFDAVAINESYRTSGIDRRKPLLKCLKGKR